MENVEGKIYSLFKARRIAKRTAAGERRGISPWLYYGLGLEDYQGHLLPCWSDERITDHVNDLLSKKKKAYVLDLAGPGQPLREMRLTGGLAVTLGDGRSEEMRNIDNSNNISVLEGDILSKSTWKSIKKWLHFQKSPGFDLILCNPVGGFTYFPCDMNLFYYLGQQAWDLLSSHYGEIYSEIPPIFLDTEDELFESWLVQLEEECNIENSCTRHSFKMIRSPESPSLLPPLDFSKLKK